jgi:ribosomal-protein-alanine N-acetyltransferase
MTWQKREMRVTVRRAHPSDLGAIMDIEQVSFPTPWSETAMRREITGQDNSYFLVVEIRGRICGYAVTWAYVGEAHVLNVAVAPHWRGFGLGEVLMLSAIQEAVARRCTQMVLEYRVSNSSAGALYEKLGFVAAGIRPRYYMDTGEDAVFAVLQELQSPATARFLDELWDAWKRRHGWAVLPE